MKHSGNHSTLRLGKADVRLTTPSHLRGVRQGNEPGAYEKQPGHNGDGTSTAARSTGVRADHKNPIDPAMPNLSPP